MAKMSYGKKMRKKISSDGAGKRDRVDFDDDSTDYKQPKKRSRTNATSESKSSESKTSESRSQWWIPTKSEERKLEKMTNDEFLKGDEPMDIDTEDMSKEKVFIPKVVKTAVKPPVLTMDLLNLKISTQMQEKIIPLVKLYKQYEAEKLSIGQINFRIDKMDQFTKDSFAILLDDRFDDEKKKRNIMKLDEFINKKQEVIKLTEKEIDLFGIFSRGDSLPIFEFKTSFMDKLLTKTALDKDKYIATDTLDNLNDLTYISGSTFIKNAIDDYNKITINDVSVSIRSEIQEGVKKFRKNPMVEMCKDIPNIDMKRKFRETNMEKYGVEYPCQNPGINKKREATNMRIYGVKSTLQHQDVKEKIKNTNLGRYGVENPSQNQDVKEKIKNTNLGRYGVESPLQNQDVKEKIKSTIMERYGVENVSQNLEVKKRKQETSLNNFGVEHPMHNAEVSERASHNAYKAYDYTFPSGRIERIQGYEKFGINDLLSQGIKEDDIVTKRTEVPICSYYDNEGKEHVYYVDILIKFKNMCVEVKSTWTMEKKKEEVLMKQKALQDLGYVCEIWIYDAKGERLKYDN
jgi:hypothetical protein